MSTYFKYIYNKIFKIRYLFQLININTILILKEVNKIKSTNKLLYYIKIYY